MTGSRPTGSVDMMPLLSYKQRMAKMWQRPNGVYYASWEENGKTRRQSLHTQDKRKAATRFRDFERRLIAGKVKPISEGVRECFYDYCDEFLEHAEASTSNSTYVQYDVALKKAKSAWGDIPLTHITTRHIDILIKDMVRSGLKIPTINKVLRHVKSALSKAYQWEYLKSPIRFPKMLKEEEQMRFLSADQLRTLIGKIDDQEFADLCLFAAYTGLRSGEILRLRWSDVDNPQGFLRISPKQKNKKESRIPINEHTRAILEKVFSKDQSKIFRFESLTWVSQKFKTAAIKAGLPDARFHDLRHTFGSHLAMAGEHVKAIQDLMRHKSIISTMVYVKVSPEYLKEASEKVNYGPMPVVSQFEKDGAKK